MLFQHPCFLMDWIAFGIKDGLQRIVTYRILLIHDCNVLLKTLFRSVSNACWLDFDGCSSIQYNVSHAKDLTESPRLSMNGNICTLYHW